MGISEKMNHLADGMKAGVKTGSARTALGIFRLLTAFFLGIPCLLWDRRFHTTETSLWCS